MNCFISIDSVVPVVITENEPFKVTFTIAVGEAEEVRSVVVTLLTDDARLMLLDHGTHESPPERGFQVSPGSKLTRTTTALIQRRKGLVDETSRDGSPAPIFLHARAKNEREEIIADGAGIEVMIAGLAKRTSPRIFL